MTDLINELRSENESLKLALRTDRAKVDRELGESREELARLRADVARQAFVITELEHRKATLIAEVDRLNARLDLVDGDIGFCPP